MFRPFALGFASIMLSSCTGDEGDLPASGDAQAFTEISPDAVIRFTGTEPFWGGSVENGQLIWTTPENIDGETITVNRFAGLGGISFSGTLGGRALDMMITPAPCSDGMSDRTYPFVATVTLGNEMLTGCAWREGDELGAP